MAVKTKLAALIFGQNKNLMSTQHSPSNAKFLSSTD